MMKMTLIPLLRSKPILYSLLKHSKQDSSGIASLKANGITSSEDTDKANPLNSQFNSVFSPKSLVSLKQLAQRTLQDLHDSGPNLSFKPRPHPKMPNIHVSTQGIEKLLKGLNPHKAAGPDKFKPIVLQALYKELAPILQLIYQRSLNSGKLPSIWKEANVSPIFKKKGIKQTPQTIDPSPLPVSSAKCLSTSWLLVSLYILQTKTFFLNCNMGFGKEILLDNSLCYMYLTSLLKTCNLENKLI